MKLTLIERVKNRALSVIDKFKRLYEWTKESPRHIAITIVCFLVITAVIIFTVRYIGYIVFAAIVIFIYWDDIKRFLGIYTPLTLEHDGVCYTVTKFMYDTICQDKPLDGIVRTPSTVNNLYDTRNYLDIYNYAPILKLRLVRNQDKEIDCGYLKDILQVSVDARITDGHLRGYYWAIPADRTIPLIKIAAMNCSDLYIHIGILLTNTAESVNAARFSDIPALPPKTDDTDPLFAKGED